MHNAHILALQGVENFRDLGGYSVGNGTIVKWGRLFRSGHLAELSEFDCQQLSPLNISSIFDLRAPLSAKHSPRAGMANRNLASSPSIYIKMTAILLRVCLNKL